MPTDTMGEMMDSVIRQCVQVGVAMMVSVAVSFAHQPSVGTVKGSVEAPDGRPVPAVRIVADSATDSAYTASSTTDQEGRFTVADAPVGVVTLRVYDAADRVVAQGEATLSQPGETVTMVLRTR